VGKKRRGGSRFTLEAMSAVLTAVASVVGETAASKNSGNRQIRCGTCRSCTASDCGECANCMDMPKFGGPGHKKQACSRRKCLQLTPCKARKPDGPAVKRAKTSGGAAASTAPHAAPFLPRIMTVLPTCGSPAELTDLMLIAEGGTEAYNSPRVAADEPDAPPAVAPVQLLREHLLLLDDDRCALDDVQPARQDGDGGSAAALGEATHALSGGFATPSLSAHPAHAGAATPFASGMADGMGHGTSSADAFATIVASTELACARFEPANLNFVDSSTTPSAASSPPRASTSVAAPLDALPCALTQADVAATALQATDSKLEWSWLALANLEEEFVSMRDFLDEPAEEWAHAS